MKIPWLQVQEYAANMYRPITDCIGDYGGWRVATSICKLKKFNETTRIGAHLDTLMFLSWAMGTTFDGAGLHEGNRHRLPLRKPCCKNYGFFYR